MKEVVFVYGTLRSGASNAWRMSGAGFLGVGRVRGVMVRVDWYPGVILEGETWVSGEVYELGWDILKELDEFEGLGEGGEYRRVRAKVDLSGEAMEAWVYEWARGIAGYPVVESGDWLEPG